MKDERTDIQIVTHALGTMLDMFESVAPGNLDEEDGALVLYCRRVEKAAEAGDMTPIRKELDEEDEEDRATAAAPRCICKMVETYPMTRIPDALCPEHKGY